MTLYRGLGLPQSAVSEYEKMIPTWYSFEFNGFTSTSVKKSVAIDFARRGTKGENIPCLLKMTVTDDQWYKAYLNSSEYSAFPSQKEVLLGYVRWKVEAVTVEKGITVIKLKDVRGERRMNL